MLISFVKELDDPTAKLLKSLADNQARWSKSPRFVVWVFQVGGDQAKVGQFLSQHGIANLPFLVVPRDLSKLELWNLNPMARNTLVFVRRKDRQTMKSFVDVDVEDLGQLEAAVTKLLQE